MKKYNVSWCNEENFLYNVLNIITIYFETLQLIVY